MTERSAGLLLQDSVRGWEYGTKLSTYDTSNENKSDGGSYGNYGFVSGAFDGGFEICPGKSTLFTSETSSKRQ